MVHSVIVEDVTYYYPGSKEPALKNINLKVESGEFFALIGPSGCGKSTLALCICGLIPNELGGSMTGRILINDFDTRKCSVVELAKEVGLLFQDPDSQLFSMRVEDEIRAGPENLGFTEEEIKERVERALEVAEINEYRFRSPQDLSSGEKQRVALAAILAMEPKILILDEPTSFLDPLGKEKIFRILRRLNEDFGLTIILISHDLGHVASLADRVALMVDGNVVITGTPREVFYSEVFQQFMKAPLVVELMNRLKRDSLAIEGHPLSPFELAEIISKRIKLPMDLHRAHEEMAGKRGEPLIRTSDLSFEYPNGLKALRHINLIINKQEFVAIVGSNGSGKTTLAKHLIGLLKPTSGEVIINGLNTRKVSVARLAREVGYVFQSPEYQIFSDTIEEEVAFGPINLGLSDVRKRVSEALRLTKLEGLEKRDPESLSSGQKRLLTIASVLAMRPNVLVLDEPQFGLDPRVCHEIMEILVKLNEEDRITIILLSHDMDLVREYAKRVVVLSKGQILADGPPYEIFNRPEILRVAHLSAPTITNVVNALRIPAKGITTLSKLSEVLARSLNHG